MQDQEEGWLTWFLNRTGGKALHHHYLTSLMADHEELYKTPHQQKMFSDSYKNAQTVGKHYCSNISMLKLKSKSPAKFDGPLTHSTMSPELYQHFSNEQAAAQECLSDSLNLYLDSVHALSQYYAVCKEECLANNDQLRKDIEDLNRAKREGQRTKYFNPHSSDKCLSACRT